MESKRLYLFGSPHLDREGVQISFDSHKVHAVLYYLATVGDAVRRDFLVSLLWPENDQPSGRALLRGSLYKARKAVADDLFVADRDTVALNRSAELWVDVNEFSNLIDRCKSHGHTPETPCSMCIELLEGAVRFFRGDFLEGFGVKGCPDFDSWQILQAQVLRESVASALQRLVLLHKASARFSEAVEYARQWVRLDQLDEEAHRALIELYARQGQRAMALRQYEDCTRILRDELGTPPDKDTIEIYNSVRDGSFGGGPAERLAVPVHNLPRQLSDFIGRKREIEKIKLLLREHRLVTLSGVGGCGKTRLALEVASQILDELTGGVRFVDLTTVSDPSALPMKIAAVLGLVEQPDLLLSRALTEYLRTKQILIIIDNCEHVLAACAETTDHLLRECGEVRILATSREPLATEGEIVWRVPSLSMPDSGKQGKTRLSELREYESVQLFVSRAQSVSSGFVVTEENASCLAEICARLDGIPLAIELAAARARGISLQEICARLGDRLTLLTSDRKVVLARHQTLRAAIDWSFDLLDEEERVLFRRLAVFTGGCTLDAVEATCADHGLQRTRVGLDSIADIITHLVDKSLVLMDCGRYRMLDMIRQYSAEKLQEAGEDSDLRRNHRDWILRLSEEAYSKTRGREQLYWFDRLDAEMDNIRAALIWTRESGEVEEGIRIIWALSWFWLVRGYFNEGYGALLNLLGERPDLCTRARAKGHAAAAVLTLLREGKTPFDGHWAESVALNRLAGDKSQTAACLTRLAYAGGDDRQEYLDEALLLYREIPDRWGAVNVLRLMGVTIPDARRARELLEESLTLCRDTGDGVNLSWLLYDLAMKEFCREDFPFTVSMLEESLEIAKTLKLKQGMAQSCSMLGLVHMIQGNYRTSRAMLANATAVCRDTGLSRWAAVCALLNLLGMAVAKEEWQNAAMFVGALEASPQHIRPDWRGPFEVWLTVVSENLTEAEFSRLVEDGREMDTTGIVELSLRADDL
jgi:predicted ATPase/DNA-binding SARP family transcriptional activator